MLNSQSASTRVSLRKSRQGAPSSDALVDKLSIDRTIRSPEWVLKTPRGLKHKVLHVPPDPVHIICACDGSFNAPRDRFKMFPLQVSLDVCCRPALFTFAGEQVQIANVPLLLMDHVEGIAGAVVHACYSPHSN